MYGTKRTFSSEKSNLVRLLACASILLCILNASFSPAPSASLALPLSVTKKGEKKTHEERRNKSRTLARSSAVIIPKGGKNPKKIRAEQKNCKLKEQPTQASWGVPKENQAVFEAPPAYTHAEVAKLASDSEESSF